MLGKVSVRRDKHKVIHRPTVGPGQELTSPAGLAVFIHHSQGAAQAREPQGRPVPHAVGPSLASWRLKGGELEDTNRANLQMNGKLQTVAKTMKEKKNGGAAAQNDRDLLPPQW